MHKIIKILFLFAAILGLSSCLNNITIDKRWVPENQDKQGDGLHTVLVEEYTGQKCVNCPSAAEELAKISEDYPGRIITVAMHATFSGQTNPELSSSCANEYAKYYNLPKSVPGIMIDRSVLSDDNKYYQQRGLWNSLISKALSRPALYRLDLKAELRPEHKIKLNVKAELLSGKKDTRDLALQLWVVEDIIAEQQTLTGKKADYFHHNVLRCHLNGIYGSDFNVTKPYNAEVNMPRCVKDENNTKLIAFIFDRNTYEIYESVIVKLGKGITEQDNKQETPQEKPQEKPQEEVENIFFKSNNAALASGGELEITAVELTGENKDRIEMETPVISVISSKKNSNKKYAVEIVKQDHKGAEFGGLSQICLENCQDSDNTESFVQKEVALTDQSIVMVHYRIAEKYKDKKDSYKVRVSFKDGDKEVAFLTLVFNYDPAKLPQQQPAPTPDPKPSEPEIPAPAPKDGVTAVSNGKPVVVAMDFTGQKCGYCIYAMRKLNACQQKYPDNMIVVAIHTNAYNVDKNFVYPGFYHYYNKGEVRYYPTVLLNNYPGDINGYLENRVELLVNKSALFKSKLQVVRNEQDLKISYISQNTDAGKGKFKDKKLNLMIWIVENNLKGYQTHTSEKYDFIHNHILRGPINGLWGESYSLGTELSLNKKMAPNVLNPENCELIAILLEEDTKHFVDALKVKL